jgi:hypothetical protein
VLAEDLPAESYIDRDDRAMFMNAPPAQFADAPRGQAGSVCAPILQSGPVFDRIRARIELRAGITPTDIMDRPQGGPLLGRVEWFDRTLISGWAWLPNHPDVPVVLEVVNRREVIAVALADQFRSDLRRSGIGNGDHAFHIDLPRCLDPRCAHEVLIRRAADGLALGGSAVTVPAIAASNALTDLDLAAMIEEADVSETRRVLEWLERQAVKLHARLILTETSSGAAGTEETDTTLDDRAETCLDAVARLSGPKLVRI